jgi:hypothetical protein
LAEGNGLVFNKEERVEGYTNFLWAVLLALFIKIGLDIVPLSQILSFLFALFTLIILFKIPKSLYPSKNPIFCVIAPAFLASNTTFAVWVMSGMESHMFALFFTASVALCLHKSRSIFLPVLLAFSSLTRPEGVLLFGITLVYKIVKEKRINLRFILIFFAIYLPYFLWRYQYYGYLFPNTYYCKVAALTEGARLILIKRGLAYTAELFRDHWGVWLILLSFILLIRFRAIWMLYCWMIVVFFAMFVIYVGGDTFPGTRLYLPILPTLFLLIQDSIKRVAEIKKREWVTFPLVILLIISFVYFSTRCTFSGRIAKHIRKDTLVEDGRNVGEYLRKVAKKGELVALNTAGSIPYYLGLDIRILDMLGLTDVHIAHQPTVAETTDREWTGHDRWDGPYVLSKKPDYILFGPCATAALFPADQQIFASLDFIKNYEPVLMKELIKPEQPFFPVYYRRVKRENPPLSVKDYEGLSKYSRILSLHHAKELLYKRGVLFFQKADWKSAEDAFKKALAIDSDHIKARYNLAASLHNQRRYDEAISEYERLLAKPMGDIDLHIKACTNLGNLCYNKKRFDYAKRAFSHILSIDPENSYAKSMLRKIP